MARLDVELREAGKSLDRLLELHGNLSTLPPAYQKLVAELIMLRLFDVFLLHVKRIACKVICGGAYLDRSVPAVHQKARSIAGAEALMQTFQRGTRGRTLRWSKVSEVKENLRHVLDPNDHLAVTLDRHGQVIDQMRRVRNRIAHNNDGARKAYAVVVRQKYGAHVRGVPPGTLLLTKRWGQPDLLEYYLKSTKVLVRTLVKG